MAMITGPPIVDLFPNTARGVVIGVGLTIALVLVVWIFYLVRRHRG